MVDVVAQVQGVGAVLVKVGLAFIVSSACGQKSVPAGIEPQLGARHGERGCESGRGVRFRA